MTRRLTGVVGGLQVALAGVLAAALTWQLARVWPGPPVERATLASLAFVPLWAALALALLALGRARPGAARRRLFALHRGLGGAIALAAMLVFGSGVGAVIDRASTRWQVEHAATGEVPTLHAQPLDEVLATVLVGHPELIHGELALHPASAAQPWIQVDFFRPDRTQVRLEFDARDGAPRVGGPGPLWVLREMHRRILAPPLLGEPVLGLVGLALTLVLLAGLATRRDWVRGLLKRRPRAEPTAMRLHQWIGLATLPAALLWTMSGALLGFTLIVVPIVGGAAYDGDRAALMREVLAVDRPAKLDEPAPTIDLQATIAASCPLVREHLPAFEVHRVLIRHPGLRSGSVRVDVEGGGLLQRGSFHRGVDGSLRDCRALPAAGIGLQGFMATIALHYGEWGPQWIVDAAYVGLGGSLVALSWLGGLLLARRREREGDGAGAARARRWLSGVGVGLPLAGAALLLLSRLPAYARDEDAALVIFAAVCATAVIVAHTGARRLLLPALALVLAAVPVVGWWAAGVRPGLAEALILGLAGAVAAVARRRPAA